MSESHTHVVEPLIKDDSLLQQLISNTLIVVPSYNAEKTIIATIEEIFATGYTNIIISDDNSTDKTTEIVKKKFPDVKIIYQEKNLGYGGNQKFLYNYALSNGYDYVVMIHGDFQYTPRLIPAISSMLHFAQYDFIFGSRILGGNALKGGMPLLKYLSNRLLTLFQNVFTGYKLSEYHSGLRGYKLSVLNDVNFNSFSNNFIFDNQMILSIIERKKMIGEVSCVTKYETNSSSISYKDSFIYAINVIYLTLIYFFRSLTK
jgi:glycosyltransferase involved in cell wall biosynthesis